MNAKALFFVSSFCGFALIALSMPRHYRDIRPASKALSPVMVKLIRSLGFLVLLSACFWSVTSQGVALGLVYGFGQMTFVALLLSLLLSYQPRWLSQFLWVSVVSLGLIGIFKGV